MNGQRIDEAGRMISAANLTAIQSAWQSLGSLLQRALGKPAAGDDEEPTEEAIREALSHQDITRALELALRAKHPSNGDGYWLWVRDVYDDQVVYTWETPSSGALYRRAYTITDAGEVTLGEPEEVVASTVYTPVSATSEAGATVDITTDVVPLIEKAVRRDNTIAIKVIDAGQGSSGYYPEETIKRDGPKVFTAGTHMYLDHPTESEAADRPERTVRDLAGTFVSDAAWRDDGPAGPGLYADAEVFAPFRDVLDEIAPHIGVSIRARGRVEAGEVDGTPTRVITSLEGADSVDFVTRAGRGGSVVALAESARGAGRVAETSPATPGNQQEVNVEDLQEVKDRLAAVEADNARLRGVALLSEAQRAATRQLASVELPTFARKRILESVTADPPTTDAGALDTAALTAAIEAQVTAWRTDLAEAGDYRIEGMGPGGEGEGEGFDPDAILEAALQDIGLAESTAKLAARGR